MDVATFNRVVFARSPNANAPRFQTISSTPGMTSIALSAALKYVTPLDA
jgi:hypothetical protein